LENSRFGKKFGDKRGGGGNRRGGDRDRNSRDDDRGFDRGGDRDHRMSRGTRFQIPSLAVIEYKNIAFLQKFVTDRGKMVSRRFSGVSAKEQRALSIAIKRARFLGLLPVGSAKRK
jgi:small subunit ribosomal protein S18